MRQSRKSRSQADGREATADPNNVCDKMCPTCPFRPGSKYSYLRADLAAAALTSGNRVCHSTGPANAINRKPKQPGQICRGARNVQLQHFHRLKVLAEPTDECWRKTLEKIRK
jgi:MinD superfamily P-loop ATPase